MGEPVAAIGDLRYLLSVPSLMSGFRLRIDPTWDPIRNDPRFAALLTETHLK